VAGKEISPAASEVQAFMTIMLSLGYTSQCFCAGKASSKMLIGIPPTEGSVAFSLNRSRPYRLSLTFGEQMSLCKNFSLVSLLQKPFQVEKK